MTQEEKQLLLKDLCARLPYGMKIDHFGVAKELLGVIPSSENVMVGYDINNYEDSVIEDIKPYLRPMSSMTEKERKEINKAYNFSDFGSVTIHYHMQGWWDSDTECNLKDYLYLINWLNEHHFDYRGLIEKELALEAPKEMYKTD